MNFDTLLKQHVSQRPDAIVLYDVDQPVSYRELYDESHRIAALLHAQGARAGDRLALWLPNCTAWLAIFMACARLDITVIAMNTRFRSTEVGDLISRGKCQWLAMWPSFKGLPFARILQDVDDGLLVDLKGVLVLGGLPDDPLIDGVPVFSYQDDPMDNARSALPPASANSLSLVYTTSGTTSLPKLVVHDQTTLIHHGMNAAKFHNIGPDDAVLLGAPFCGAFGFSSAVAGLAAGAALITAPVTDPAECAEQIKRFRATHTFANNELLDRIMDAVKGQDNPFPSMRIAGFASFAPSLDDLPERIEAAGITLVGLYGSSELQALVAAQPAGASLESRKQAGGQLASPDARVRARDTETGDILPHGQIGEIEIASPSMMKGYLDNEQATQGAIDAQGYFRTGDLGHTTSEQHFVFHARKGDFMRLSGFLVNPAEIEQYVEAMDGVQTCQVVGARHQDKMVAVAFVKIEADRAITETAIIHHCKAGLAGFKVPARVAIVDEFPVVQSANSNKIQRGKLQEMAQDLLERLSINT